MTIQLKNVGLSRIAFDQEVSSLAVFEFVPSQTEEILRVKNSLVASLMGFGDTDRYIEPNEVFERQTLIALPHVSSIGYQLELNVLSVSGYIWRWVYLIGLENKVMKLSDYPPGFSAPKYRATPEEIERLRRLNQIQEEKEERHRRKLIEEGKLPPDDEPGEKP